MERDFPTLRKAASIDDVCTMAGCVMRLLIMAGVKVDEDELRELLIDGAVFSLHDDDAVSREMWECMLNAAFPQSDGTVA